MKNSYLSEDNRVSSGIVNPDLVNGRRYANKNTHPGLYMASAMYFLITIICSLTLLVTLYFLVTVGNPQFLYATLPSYKPLVPLFTLICLASAWLSPMGRAFEYPLLATVTLLAANLVLLFLGLYTALPSLLVAIFVLMSCALITCLYRKHAYL